MNKAHILEEICRTADSNNAVPLGERKFEETTGIKKSDWYGIFWARWGDAVREAGLTPNQLRTAYDKNKLLGKYAELARKLGRIPAKGDLALCAHNNLEFPDPATFGNRFGTKLELVKQLADYCRDNAGYEHVLQLCDKYVPRKQDRAKESGLREQVGEIGFVYLAKSGRFFKIGKTNAVGRREYELAIQLPEKAKTVHEIRTDDPSGIEAYWHARFSSKRKNGEWFDLSAEEVAAFKRRKFM